MCRGLAIGSGRPLNTKDELSVAQWMIFYQKSERSFSS